MPWSPQHPIPPLETYPLELHPVVATVASDVPVASPVAAEAPQGLHQCPHSPLERHNGRCPVHRYPSAETSLQN